MDGKQRILSQTDQEILSLCKVKAKDEEIEGSEEVTTLHLSASRGKLRMQAKQICQHLNTNPAQVKAQMVSRTS